MKKLRALVLIVMTVVVLGCGSVQALATDETENELIADENFIEMCERIFSGNGEIIDSVGNDITDYFVSKYSAYFESGEYTEILKMCFDEGVSELRGHYSEKLETRASVRKVYEETAIHLVTNVSYPPYPGKEWYLLVTVSGVILYDTWSEQIISCPSPTVSIEFGSLGALFTGNLTSVNVSTPVIDNSNYSVSFFVTTVHTVSYPIPGLDYITGELGPFTNMSNFTINYFE